MSGKSAFEGISAEDRQKLADDFYNALHKELSQDYRLVDQLGPGVMRIQVALTDAKGSSPVMDTISTVMPIGLAISQTKGLITGKPSFVGETQAEAKVTDGTNGHCLPPLSIAALAASRSREQRIPGMMCMPRSNTGRSNCATGFAPKAADRAARAE